MAAGENDEQASLKLVSHTGFWKIKYYEIGIGKIRKTYYFEFSFTDDMGIHDKHRIHSWIKNHFQLPRTEQVPILVLPT